MSVAALIRELRANDILLSLNGDALVVDAPEALITDELRARIAASKPEILSLLRAARGDGHGLKLTPAPRDQRIPLSSAQRRLWFLNRLDPGETVYNMGLGLDVAEPVDVDALERALAALVSRHDILRTAFPDDEGEPSQVVTERAPPLLVADLRTLPATEREARLDAERQIAVAHRFRLAERPPFNTTLIRWGEEKALLVIVLHHILADGWSLDLLAAEFAQLYADGVEGRAPSAVPPKWRYADYAWSQQEWLHHANFEEATSYWRRTLAGELTPLDLPTDHPHAAILSSHGATHRFSLSRELSASLRARSREAGTTLFTMLLATYELLLHRYTGQTDILVGTPVANRPLVELEPLVGLFASTVVLRADLAGDPSFRDLLRRAQEAVLGAFDHQAYPFDKVVELVRPERSRSRTPLFQTMFSLQGTPAPGAPPYEIFGSGAHFELSLGAWDDGERIHGRWEYNADLFDASTIERMSGHFVNLAESVAADPTRRLSALSPLTPAELARMTVEWNDTAAPFPAECAHELVDAQAAATPLAEAVRFGDVSVTYGELVARANQLAHRLKAAGVGRERLVGICLDRGPEKIVALLAVLKAGGAYVPLDPSYPRERLAFMAADADLVAVITEEAWAAALPEGPWTVLSLDREAVAIAREPVTAPAHRSRHADLAYVLYTSGSMGKPKGVMVEHGSLMNLLHAVQTRPGLAAGDCLLSVTTLSFDIAGLEIFLPLLVGARIHLVSRGEAMDGHALARTLAASGATVMQATPATWRLLIDSGWREGRDLKIISGGEALSRELADALLDSGAEVWNGYGPTETTIYSTFQKVERDHRPVPIGRPIANTTAYVLSADRQPVPVHVTGELYLGGRGLARGYRHRDNLTAERFVPNPFVTDAGARLYRTGDRVRYRADGSLEYLGRTDTQVKIRGFRIELAEVEAVLAGHPAVRAAVVMAREDTPGDRRLVAYVVAEPPARLTRESLRERAAALLPDYMIPSHVVMLDALPLTPSGKVDRRALPAPGPSLRTGPEDRPLSALETQVRQVWEEVMGLGRLHLDDNFFELGGNSFLGVRLLARLEGVIGHRIPVSILYQGQTIESMAAALRRDMSRLSFCAVELQPGTNQLPLFVVPGVDGRVIGYGALAKALGTDLPVYGLRSVGLDGEEPARESAESIADAFVPEMLKVQPTGPFRVAGLCMGGVVAWEIAQRLAALGERVELLALIDTWPPGKIPRVRAPSRLAAQAAFLREGLGRHARELVARPMREWPGYLRAKLTIVAEMVATRDLYRGDHIALHHSLVRQANLRAAAEYSPRPFQGRITLVFTERLHLPLGRDPRYAWARLATGGAEVSRVAGPDSGALLVSPFASGLGRALREQLDARLAERHAGR